MTGAIIGFIIFGVLTQFVLAAFFAARRWFPRAALPVGRAAYSAAALGLPLGVWLAIGGQSWRLWMGPLLLAAWAAFGASLDLWRKVEWRNPIMPRLFVPFLVLYFFAQMFLWWPLWSIDRGAWAVFAVLFVANTTLNLAGHSPGRPREEGPTGDQG